MEKRPSLSTHTHYQVPLITNHTRQNLPKSMAARTLDERNSTGIQQHCIRAIAGEVENSRSVHLINFGDGGQVIALKSATALILDRLEVL